MYFINHEEHHGLTVLTRVPTTTKPLSTLYLVLVMYDVFHASGPQAGSDEASKTGDELCQAWTQVDQGIVSKTMHYVNSKYII